MALRRFGIYALILFLSLSIVLQSEVAQISGFDEPIHMPYPNGSEQLEPFDVHPPLGKYLYSFAQHGAETCPAFIEYEHSSQELVLLFSAPLSRITPNTSAVATSCTGLLSGQFRRVYSTTTSPEICIAFRIHAIGLCGERCARKMAIEHRRKSDPYDHAAG